MSCSVATRTSRCACCPAGSALKARPWAWPSVTGTTSTPTVPGVSTTTSTLAFSNERGSDGLKTSGLWSNDLEPVGLGTASLGRQYRDDGDPVDLDIGLDSEHFSNFWRARQHRGRDEAARLEGSRGAPSPVAIVARRSEFNFHTSCHCGGEASSSCDLP